MQPSERMGETGGEVRDAIFATQCTQRLCRLPVERLGHAGLEKLRYILFGHPLSTAGVLGSFGILANVLSGAYTFDITRTDPKSGPYIAWSTSLHSLYFWTLVGLALLLALYGWGMARMGHQVRKAFSDDDIRDQAYQALMPTMLDRFKQDIADGKTVTMAEVLKALGTGKDAGR